MNLLGGLKRKKDFNNVTQKNIKQDFSAPKSGYTFTSSYIKTGSRYATILKITNRYGMNRNMSFGWFVKLIPSVTIEGVKAYLIEADKSFSTSEQIDIVRENVDDGIVAIEQGDINNNPTEHEQNQKKLRKMDLQRISLANGQGEQLIDCSIRIKLVSDDPDKLNIQLSKLQSIYDDEMHGIQLESVGGDQKSMLKSLLQSPDGGTHNYTWDSADFAGNEHIIRKGLSDKNGWAIGSLTASYAGGEALMALDESFDPAFGRKGIVTVAAHKSSYIQGYSEKISASSLWGQIIANNAMVNGNRTHHIVLNGFKYKHDSSENAHFAVPSSFNQISNYVDLSRGGINPLQMFGDKDKLISIYNNSLNKIIMEYYLLAERKLDQSSRIELKKALNQFYIDENLWYEDAESRPGRTRIMDIKDPSKFPTSRHFVLKINNLLSKATTARESTEAERDRVKILHNILENALTSHGDIFNKTTTLPNKQDRRFYQNYYDLSQLRTEPNILEAQFLNVFDYIVSSAKKREVVMIHGVDSISTEVLRYIKTTIDLLKENDIRFVYLFDDIGSVSSSNNTGVEYADLLNTKGILYQDLNKDFDFSIVGTMTTQELELYEKLVTENRLPENVRTHLTNASPVQYQIRRPYDNASNMLTGDFVI
ncbi:hypothetical protein [Listeria welshimeri]|uniref:hypothetical protein n=1 Tax=Listeria welshimeri TaxID=1643 RepID=UPI001889A8F3|nr:hypothetical protein [Listeria welshimeri]MBF2342548.1 hypothetical protein [Listeria welshimeri]